MLIGSSAGMLLGTIVGFHIAGQECSGAGTGSSLGMLLALLVIYCPLVAAVSGVFGGLLAWGIGSVAWRVRDKALRRWMMMAAILGAVPGFLLVRVWWMVVVAGRRSSVERVALSCGLYVLAAVFGAAALALPVWGIGRILVRRGRT